MATIEDISKKLSKMDNDSKGKYWEELTIWYLKNSPIYKNIVQKVWKFYEWPERWKTESGVDLVVQTKQGDYWAIQCKGYKQDGVISLNDIRGWLTDSNRSIFKYRILISTNSHLNNTALDLIKGQEKPAGFKLYPDLFDENLNWPSSNKKRNTFDKHEPYPHQSEAIKEVLNNFKKGEEKGKLIMACGTGKTLTSLWIDEKLKSNLTVCFFPSLTLLGKTFLEWNLHTKKNFISLPVCSDKTITQQDEIKFISNSLGVPSTTQKKDILNFLKNKEKKVIFCTYQSSKILVDLFKKEKIIPDFVIYDEAHRTVGTKGNNFSVAVKSNFKASKKLFMTATPVIFNSSTKGKMSSLGYETLSMDDDEIYGKTFHHLGFGKAISEKILSDYQLKILEIDSKDVKNILYNYPELNILKKKWPANNIASIIALKIASKELKLNKFISFHNSIHAAKKFSENFNSIAEDIGFKINNFILAGHLNGSQKSYERLQRLNDLNNLKNNEYGFISNSRCLAEGVDVPELDGVLITEPRHSQTDIIQIVGRAMRKKKNKKKKGYILVPIVIDRESDFEEQLENDAFKNTVKVIRSLISHDDRLNLYIKKLILKKGRSGFKGKDLEPYISISKTAKFPTKLMDQFILKSVIDLQKNWYLKYKDYEKFVIDNKKHPHYLKQKTLYNWATRQKGDFEILDAEQKELLEKIPDWVWEKDVFEEKYEELKMYLKKNNNIFIVPSSKENKDSLNVWVSGIRATYKSEEKTTNGDLIRRTGDEIVQRLSTEQIKKLNDLHWTWTWNPTEFVWNMHYSFLQFYYQNENSIYFPVDFKVDIPKQINFKLPRTKSLNMNMWKQTQRSNYRVYKGKSPTSGKRKIKENYFSEEKIQTLESIDKNFFKGYNESKIHEPKFIYKNLNFHDFVWSFENKQISQDYLKSLKWGTEDYWENFDFQKDKIYLRAKKIAEKEAKVTYAILEKELSDIPGIRNKCKELIRLLKEEKIII